MLALNVTGQFPDVRAGRIAEASSLRGWTNDAIGMRPPPQFEYVYRTIRTCPYWDWPDFVREVASSKADLLHVHCELYSTWAVLAAKEGARYRPVIANIHDLACAREESLFDAFEEEALATADAHIWVTPEQREFAGHMGLCIDKPHIFVPNFASSSFYIERSMLPHVGGVVYAGSIAERGDDSNRRDLSRVADTIPLHIYPGNAFHENTYGLLHEIEYDYALLIHKLGQHDWGFAGHPDPNPSWGHSIPTKVGEYWAAGIPFVALNVPTLEPYAAKGMGICVKSLSDLKHLPDPKPYRKAVMEHRGQYTTQRCADEIDTLYRSLL